MTNLTYEYTEGKPNADIRVALEGKIVGTIKKVATGWQYVPKGSKKGGEIFPTASACQQSLKTK